jgi:peptidyl-tRNA hydrolase
MSKLYLITRKDLTPGAQMAQVVHVMREFVEDFPKIEKHWYKSSNTVVILSVDNEDELYYLVNKAKQLDIKVSKFHEPDLGNQLTAIALEPLENSKILCRGIKLALIS